MPAQKPEPTIDTASASSATRDLEIQALFPIGVFGGYAECNKTRHKESCPGMKTDES